MTVVQISNRRKGRTTYETIEQQCFLWETVVLTGTDCSQFGKLFSNPPKLYIKLLKLGGENPQSTVGRCTEYDKPQISVNVKLYTCNKLIKIKGLLINSLSTISPPIYFHRKKHHWHVPGGWLSIYLCPGWAQAGVSSSCLTVTENIQHTAIQIHSISQNTELPVGSTGCH